MTTDNTLLFCNGCWVLQIVACYIISHSFHGLLSSFLHQAIHQKVWNNSGTQTPHPPSTGQSSGRFNTQESTALLTIFSCFCQAVWGEAVRKCPFPTSSPPGTWCRLIAVCVWYPALSQEGVNYLPCATWPALCLGCWHMARHHSSFCFANLQFY